MNTLLHELRASGPNKIIWDGRDEVGLPVPQGVYFCRMTAGDWHREKKLILLGH